MTAEDFYKKEDCGNNIEYNKFSEDDFIFTKKEMILFAEKYHKSKMPTREIIKQAFDAGREKVNLFHEPEDDFDYIYENYEDYEDEILNNGSC